MTEKEKKSYILKAQGPLLCAKDAATHPRALEHIISQIEGIDIIENDLPNLWMVSATEQGIAQLTAQVQGWLIVPQTEWKISSSTPSPHKGPQP